MRGTAAVAPRADGRDSGVRLAELMAALSIATDLGMGQPLETALSTCIVAMRLGTTLGLDDDAMRDIYYQSLLRFIGCNAETHLLAALVGDELALRRDFAPIDPGNPPEMIDLVIRYIRQANAAEARARVEEIVARGLLTLPELTRDSFAGHCEVAQRLAQRMGLPESLITCLGQLYERWDGHGLPSGLQGEVDLADGTHRDPGAGRGDLDSASRPRGRGRDSAAAKRRRLSGVDGGRVLCQRTGNP